MEYALSPLFAFGISLFLLLCSALFSGLTLGLMSLNVHTLKRQKALGDEQAARIYPLRKKGNQLLTTLLLGNVAVNTALSIFLGSLAPGLVAGFVATALIFVLGEIVPQAVVSRHAMAFGSRTAPLVHVLMFIAWPITAPIAKALDRALGEELPTVYSKHELMHIISEHEDSHHSPIDEDEERILHGALQFSNKKVSEVMTPRSSVYAIESSEILDKELRQKIIEHGHSRMPVYRRKLDTIVGILYTKDILLEPTNQEVVDACDPTYIRVRENEKLDTVLACMLKRRQHMAIAFNNTKKLIGVITLEDILEEVLQQEILDEDDHIVDLRKKKEVK